MKTMMSGLGKITAVLVLTGAALGLQAVDFPAAVDGTITLTTPGTYGAYIPAGTTKLVVDVTGTATLSGTKTSSDTAFAGEVEVMSNSTLIVTVKELITGASSITVKNGGTFEPKLPGPGQNVCLLKMPISIAGTGNGTGYAFRFTQNGGVSCPDSVVNHLILTEDATIDCSARWGVSPAGGKGLIDLQGHTLTRTGGNNLMMFSASLTPGRFVNTNGEVTFQTRNSAPFHLTGAPEETVVEIQKGTMTFWSCGKPVPYKVVLNGGWLRASSGSGLGVNAISGPVEINKWVTSQTPIGKSLTFAGPLSFSNTYKLFTDGDSTAGIAYVTNKVTTLKGDSGLQVDKNGTIVLCGADMGNPELRMVCGSMVFDADKANLNMFRCANGATPAMGVFRQVRGDLSFGYDTPRVGEGVRSFGAYVLESGTITHKSLFYVAKERQNSHGLFLQKGGRITLSAADFYLGTNGAEAFFVQEGGTNNFASGKGQSWRYRLGASGGSNIVYSVSGPNSVFATDAFYYGDTGSTNTLKAVMSIRNGATFKASRLKTTCPKAPGTHETLWLDGATICPLLGWGWSGLNTDNKNFYDNRPSRTIVAEKGVVIDLTETGAESFLPITLEKPEGQGLASIDLPTGVSGFTATNYAGPVCVEIVGPAGSFGASAYADYDFTNKTLKGIVVLTPGCNYDATTKIYLRSRDCEKNFLCSSFTLTGAQKSGSLTKRGPNKLSVYNTCTYEGGTVVEQGSVVFAGKGQLPDNAPLSVWKGASLTSNGNKAIRASRLSGQGKLTTSGLTITESLDVDAAAFAADATPLTLTTSGAKATFADGATVSLTLSAAEIEALKAKRWARVLTAPGGIVGTPTLIVNGAPAEGWRLKVAANTLKVGWGHGLTVLVK